MTNTTVQFVDRSTTVRFPVGTMSTATFFAMMRAYNDGLEFFNSNEDALDGTNADGDAVDALEVGDEYKAGPGHVSAAHGTKMIVV